MKWESVLVLLLLPSVLVFGIGNSDDLNPGEQALALNIGLGLMSCLYAFLLFRFMHRIMIVRGTPTAKTRSAPQGYVELIGVAELLPQPILSPHSKTPCCWYEYTLSRQESNSRGEKSWRTTHHECSQAPIILRDDTGLCLLRPQDAEIIGPKKKSNIDKQWRPLHMTTLTEIKFGEMTFSIGDRRYQHTETVLEAGSELYAIGDFYTLTAAQKRNLANEDIEQELQNLENIKQLANKEVFGFKLGDALPEGALDEERIRKNIMMEQMQKHGIGVKTNNFMRKPQGSRRPYIISSKGESGLLGRYTWQSAIWALALTGCLGVLVWLQL